MRIALCSDEPYAVHQTIEDELARRGHEVVRFGAIASKKDEPWADVAEQAALAVRRGECDEGIFLCWTGTGISIAANKVEGIRAALCADPPTAAGARVWNHANVLCLSNRTLSPDVAKEILAAWFDTPAGDRGAAGVTRLAEVEQRHRGRQAGRG
ncbi:RpiB/LacA/LacB family sugar-phosphate isomerase [Pendulispora albinea]|uniref:RpiB/LacA/LacB family sugar-phosphate isomerase n=1 Tax=Pendulispora albinea TaxID=2741071 RepID=A0ABZ2LZF6_9BACT